MLFKTARQVFVFIVGITVLLLGFALVVLPGPAIVVIPLGLAILATEFAWAKFWLRKYKNASTSVFSGIRDKFFRKAPSASVGRVCAKCGRSLRDGPAGQCPDCDSRQSAIQTTPDATN